jgi:hypothetical protein
MSYSDTFDIYAPPSPEVAPVTLTSKTAPVLNEHSAEDSHPPHRGGCKWSDMGIGRIKSLRQKGAQRGIRLVLLDSLMTCLSGSL